jgi:hypothetical protein
LAGCTPTSTNNCCAGGITTSNCGTNGGTCQSCPLGQLCTAGACVPPTTNKKVGDPCVADGDCKSSLGATAICKLMTTTGNGTYVGGYCTLPCTGTCPTGSSCIGLQPQYGEADRICWDNCGAGDLCRSPGYACYTVGSTTNACWINPLPAVDAGRPADKVGRACAGDTDCQNPPDIGGICLDREANRNWADGYCSKEDCSTNTECSSDGGALCIGMSDTLDVCIQRCGVSTPRDGGAADCRVGYVCNQYFNFLADGGVAPSTDGICYPPDAPLAERTGQACASDTECQVPSGSIADCLPATLPDAGPTGYPDGYCSRINCADTSECSTDGGAICLFFSQTTSACFQQCPTGGGGQTTCRSGYVCESWRNADGGASAEGYCTARCDQPGAGCGTTGTCLASGYCQ